MRILIATSDLYGTTGGGQTVYRRIIEETPNCQFFYFLDHEPATHKRPHNALAIPLRTRRRVIPHHLEDADHIRLQMWESANQFARSVAGESFDIVDVPDFETAGAAFRTAFAHHRVTARKIVLALHGSCSTSRRMNWDTNGCKSPLSSLDRERAIESEQFMTADAVYGISPRYIREWQERHPRYVHFIDPLHFLPRDISLASTADAYGKPTLYCVGRSERRKGHDLFIELVRWLQEDSYTAAKCIGDQDWSHIGKGSFQILAEMAKRRRAKTSYHNSLYWEQLSDLYHAASVLILPSRYDTLNLVALEAIFSGCPVAVSSEAGVCEYLDSYHPDIPYVSIDLDNFYSAVPALQAVVSDYDAYRRKQRQALMHVSLPAHNSLNMGELYGSVLSGPSDADSRAQPETGGVNYDYTEGSYRLTARLGRTTLNALSPLFSDRGQALFRNALAAPTRATKYWLRKFPAVNVLHAGVQAALAPYRAQRCRRLMNKGLEPDADILAIIKGRCRSPYLRCTFYDFIAGLERRRGNDLLAAAYELRMLRLVGHDRFRILPRVLDTLESRGLSREAEAARAMFAMPSTADHATYDYLVSARETHKPLSPRPLELFDDRRDRPAKVAVIVSLYNAAPKLRMFLEALSRQSLIARGAVEIILVDSGSPDAERFVVEEFLRTHTLNIAYARSTERETIQAAWNRGISLATAPYLVFLGVDETLYPESLDLLADTLDRHPDIDWVMANSLVTDVSNSGLLERDVMTYDRHGAGKDHTYLDTCYLSWVGGMYRKTIHDRFGYYDETFTAAGDTEFKSRVLPMLKVLFVPRTLGLFLNYPDERTTASPRAELEDLRAWYVHRTPAGVRYAFENRTLNDCMGLLGTALGYRKSFCSHLSTDVEYASLLADYMVSSHDTEPWLRPLANDLRLLLASLRGIEAAQDGPLNTTPLRGSLSAMRHAGRIQLRYGRKLKSMGFTPRLVLYNDNRFEQHTMLWKS